MLACATFASTRARADLAAHRHEIARVRVLLHVRRARARLAPAVVPIEAFQVHGQLSQPCMCMRAPRFSERSPRRSLNCTTASDAGSVGIGPLCVDRVAPSSRARASSESPSSCCGARPGATTRDRAAGRVRSGGMRSARPNKVRTGAGSRTPTVRRPSNKLVDACKLRVSLQTLVKTYIIA